MKISSIFFLLIFISTQVLSQQYMTRTGFAGFYSKMPMEDIKAENKQVYAVIDVTKKNIAVTLLLKGFIFTKELMQEHFNENYVESDKYPKANFSGNYTVAAPAGSDSIYNVTVKGTLFLHNVTRNIEVPATLKMQQGIITGETQFKMKPEDYDITIPSIVRDKIAKEITVKIKLQCTQIK